MNIEFPFKSDSIYFQYSVKDIERAKNFYVETFGFEVVWDGGTEVGWCELNLPVKGTKLGLNLLPEAARLVQGSGVLTFEVTNLEKAKNLLTEKKVHSDDIIDIIDLVSYFNATDSEGNKIQFVGEPRMKN
ncbi:MAG: VOC family protein [Promethearchaeota archaeon]|jgi:catechol 2,3-dioxygenase-like lactoylglutathione lyase family enzyme